ncbi:MAG TPA: hypothetical protein VGP47_01330, partial [Parachlamydiaceae bacterium]|nr:hypothetical protein [Parachlamydiaceae bacterium]
VSISFVNKIVGVDLSIKNSQLTHMKTWPSLRDSLLVLPFPTVCTSGATLWAVNLAVPPEL